MIGDGVHIYILYISIYIQYIYYMIVDQKKLNRTLAIDSPFQTFAIELLVELIDYVALPLLSPETLSLSSKSRLFLYNLSGWMTQLPAQTHR